jgi:hypothetical protein
MDDLFKDLKHLKDIKFIPKDIFDNESLINIYNNLDNTGYFTNPPVSPTDSDSTIR